MPLLLLLWFILLTQTGNARSLPVGFSTCFSLMPMAPFTAYPDRYRTPPQKFVNRPEVPGIKRIARWEPGSYLLSAYEAPLEQLLIQPHPRTIPVIQKLLAKLPANIEVILLVSSNREAERLHPWFIGHKSTWVCRVSLVIAPSHFPYSAWIRDSYLSLATPRHHLIFARPAAVRVYSEHDRGDAETPIAAAQLAGAALYDSSVFFEGGNVRIGIRPSGQRDIFVNTHFYQANHALGIPDSVVESEERRLFGPSPVVLPEVDPHLDTYVTFSAGGQAIVGDPRLAFPLLDSREETFITPAYRAIQRYDDIAKLDFIAKKLQKLGYQMYRIPWLPQPTLNPANVFLTYNNGVFLDSRTFIMPIYGLPTDAIAQHVFEKMGLRVLTVDVRSMSWGGGTLHCITHEGARMGFVRYPR